MNETSFLKPCLVLGTGFHRWVLGDSMSGAFQPLLDWNALIMEVARKLGIALNRSDYNLSLHWELLLTRGIEDGVNDPTFLTGTPKKSVSSFERFAKLKVAEVLAILKVDYPVHSKRARLPLSENWGSVISLNFDAHWLEEERRWGHEQANGGDTQPVMASRSVLEQELLRLNNHVALDAESGKRLWFPNGYIKKPASIRLGLREYGFQPAAIQHAFAALKAFERKAGEFEKRIGFVRAALNKAPTLQRFIDDEIRLPLTWVTEMLYRPVCFAGVGLSEAESGLWWLMVQRARNLANVEKSKRPPACILIREDDARLSFWRTRPCGIKPIICGTWDEGWEQVREWSTGFNEGGLD